MFKKLHIAKTLIFLSVFLTKIVFAQQELPFFDDFSKKGSSFFLSTQWQPSGVHKNNSFVLNPPTQYVATFDGRNAAGFPYNTTDKNAIGATDSLMSKPINLSEIKMPDSLIISFYWLAGGYSERPDKEDSLVLYFKNNSNVWDVIWKQKGDSTISSVFKQQLITIKNTAYFHADFQFAFVAYGRQSGVFDTWHLDNVLIDKKINTVNGNYEDVAIQSFSQLLKNYHSMPLRQFLVNPAKEINDSLTYKVNGIGKIGSTVLSYIVINDTLSKKNLVTVLNDSTEFIFNRQAVLREGFKLDYSKLNPKAHLQYGVKITIDSTNNPFIKLQNLIKSNDSLFYYTALDNFYAYDDGTAESAADVDTRLGTVATRFVLNKADTLGAIQVHFNPYFRNKAGENFYIRVFDSKNGFPNTVIHEEAVKIKYAEKADGFTEYILKKSIAVKDTFYVGWTRLTEDFTPIGLDKNSPHYAHHIFYNLGQEWKRNVEANGQMRIAGSLMLRPVMGKRTTTETNIEDNVLANEAVNTSKLLYPNPSNGLIYNPYSFSFDVTIFDINGVIVKKEKLGSEPLDVAYLKDGIYIFRLENKMKSFNQKIIIKK